MGIVPKKPSLVFENVSSTMLVIWHCFPPTPLQLERRHLSSGSSVLACWLFLSFSVKTWNLFCQREDDLHAITDRKAGFFSDWRREGQINGRASEWRCKTAQETHLSPALPLSSLCDVYTQWGRQITLMGLCIQEWGHDYLVHLFSPLSPKILLTSRHEHSNKLYFILDDNKWQMI